MPITTNASSVKEYLDQARAAWNRIESGTKTFTTRYEAVKPAPKGIDPYATGLAKGINFHRGGLGIAND